MKKVILATILGILILILVTAPSAPPGYPNYSQWCKDSGDLSTSHGGCVTFYTASKTRAAVAYNCRQQFWQDFFGVDNHGQCVKAFNAWLP